MSGLWKSTLIKGNKITDFAQTSATVGIVIPFGRGRFPVDGNIIFAALPPKEHRTVTRQGKGGTKTENFTYTMSYSIAFCVGPIYGYWWIKRNGKVVWTNDPNAPIEDQAYAAKWAQKATFYYGTSSQMPDSTIESYKGSGQVSAFRYLSHIVVEDDDVTDGGGAVPSYEAVCIASPPEIYLTSKPYAQTFYDNARGRLIPTGGNLDTILLDSDIEEDEVSVIFAPAGGVLQEVFPPEIHDAVDDSFLPTGGTMLTPPVPEFHDAVNVSFAPSGGTLKDPPLGTFTDDADVGFLPDGGTMDTIVIVAATKWDAAAKNAGISLANSDTEATKTGGTYGSVYATTGKSTGKWQWEGKVTALPAGGSNGPSIGLADKTNQAGVLAGILGSTAPVESAAYAGGGINYYNLTTYGSGLGGAVPPLALNDIVTITIDLTLGTPEAKFYRNGTLQYTRTLPTGKTWYPALSIRRDSVVRIIPVSLTHPQSGFTDIG